MSDPTIPASPAPVVPPASPTAVYPPPPPAYAPPAERPKQGLSLTSFILGIAGFVLAFALGFGLLIAVAAVIIGFVGRKREPGAPKWMSLVGIIAGFVGIAVALIVGGLFAFTIVAAAVSGDAYGNF